jgi:hypothetical protein
MATKLNGSMEAAATPTVVFTAYSDFVVRLTHTTGASTVQVQSDLLDASSWETEYSSTVSETFIVEVPEGTARKFRLNIGTLDTGPVAWAVYGKLNANDTIGGVLPGLVELEESGDQALEEDSLTLEYEEAA